MDETLLYLMTYVYDSCNSLRTLMTIPLIRPLHQKLLVLEDPWERENISIGRPRVTLGLES